ncbi:hypothetical protein E2P81_ATG02321 [Venturia nashicola]|uniref:F-box domain-containing protein n=1 Tax=Venturia nashicola TaxID=86259 RepID=A0A4Z1P4W6_9PEZI|nr:hypothetical protein E6O75_ATG02378 [Venturia nashicola]TLD36539.1 hypothetical protein E2P81_ATG02321 [Venturia nashicola]
MSSSRVSLLGLPVELMELIFDHILDPLDFCNASSTCKTLRSVSARLMIEHRTLAEKYQTVEFSAPEDGGPSVWALWDELLNNWRICYHIRKLVFGPARALQHDDWASPDDPIPYPYELINKLRKMDGFDLLPIDMAFESAADDPFNALLVRQLRNLREITYVNDGIGDDVYRLITEYEWEANPPFLTTLRTVNLEHWDTEGGLGLEWVIAFMRNPSVRTINGYMVEASEDYQTLSLPKSNVATLNLSTSCIELIAFDQLIEITQNLESFSYEHGGSIVGDGECDPYGMVAVLLKHAGHSLETLKIDYGDEDGMFEDLTYCSIRDFKKLKVVELDHLTLVPYQKDIMNDADADEPLSQGFYEEPEQTEDAGPSEFDLANALPATIQHLRVNRFPGSDGLPSLRHLLGKKEQGCFPELNNISLDFGFFESPDVMDWEDLQKEFAIAGVILESESESELKFTSRRFEQI